MPQLPSREIVKQTRLEGTARSSVIIRFMCLSHWRTKALTHVIAVRQHS